MSRRADESLDHRLDVARKVTSAVTRARSQAAPRARKALGRGARMAAVWMTVLVAGCGPSASPTAPPTAQPPTVAPPTLEATKSPTESLPTPTLPTVPEDPDAFAEYVIEQFGRVAEVDLALDGYTWVSPSFLRLETDEVMTIGRLANLTKADREAWARDLTRSMIAFAGDDEWSLQVQRRYLETSTTNAGFQSATMSGWLTFGEFDADLGGFWVDEDMVQITSAGGGEPVVAKVYPNTFTERTRDPSE